MPESVTPTHALHSSNSSTTTSPASSTEAIPSDATLLGGLYEHKTRPEWGLALRGLSCDGRTAYQFQDGKPRKIADSHIHLMVEVDRPRDESQRMQRELALQAGLSVGRRERRGSGEEVFTLDQQVRLFLEDFADGFREPSFVKSYRGTGKRRNKRHRDPAVAQAGELLGRSVMLSLIAAYQHDEIIARAVEVLQATSLVTARQLIPLTSLDEAGKCRAATALCNLLYGDVVLATAMQAWVDALATAGKGVSWPLATALPALVMPHNHVCVHATAFGAQARWMAPSLRLAKSVPSGALYARVHAMALRTAEELEARDVAPRDLLDVYDFVRLTLRPAERARLSTMPSTPLVVPTEPSNDGPQEKEGKLLFEATIDKALPNGRFLITCDNGMQVLAYVAGRLRRYRIRVLPGDHVDVEVSAYDPTRGRIIFRRRAPRVSVAA